MINPKKSWNELGSTEIWTGQTVAWNEGYDAIEETVVMTINPSFTGTTLGTFNDNLSFDMVSEVTETSLKSSTDSVTFTLATSATYLSTYSFEFETVFSLNVNLGHTLQAVFDAIESFPLEISENVLAGKFIYDQVALSLSPDLNSSGIKEYSDSVNFTIRGFEFAADGQGVALEFVPMQLKLGMAENSFALYDHEVDMQVTMDVLGFIGGNQTLSVSVSFNIGTFQTLKNLQWNRTLPTFGLWTAEDAEERDDWTPDAPTFGSWN